jgi:hypothetical protein
LAIRVDLTKLSALAEKINSLENDISVLSGNATQAAKSVIDRSYINSYQPLKSSCNKAAANVNEIKDMTKKILSNLKYQADTAREAAALYDRYDKIENVNK